MATRVRPPAAFVYQFVARQVRSPRKQFTGSSIMKKFIRIAVIVLVIAGVATAAYLQFRPAQVDASTTSSTE